MTPMVHMKDRPCMNFQTTSPKVYKTKDLKGSEDRMFFQWLTRMDFIVWLILILTISGKWATLESVKYIGHSDNLFRSKAVDDPRIGAAGVSSVTDKNS